MQKQKQIARELVQLHKKHGVIRADHVVEAARDHRSAMHPHITWDETQAAQERRLDQARQIIRLTWVDVQSELGPVRVPAFVSSFPVDGDRGYHDSTTVPTLNVLELALRDLAGWAKRYRGLLALHGISLPADPAAHLGIELPPVPEPTERKARKR